MTAAPEIPADVMAAAHRIWFVSDSREPVQTIARAILAERRRCMEAVNHHRPATQDMLSTSICDALDCIAHDIHQGHQA